VVKAERWQSDVCDKVLSGKYSGVINGADSLWRWCLCLNCSQCVPHWCSCYLVPAAASLEKVRNR
jgi:hypothetical protein